MMNKVSEKLNQWIGIGRNLANRKNMVSLISCVLMIMIVYVLTAAVRWSFHCADDFSHANEIGVYGGNAAELLKASVNFVIYRYQNTVGAYFTFFLQGFLSPLNGLGEGQLSAVLVVNLLLFAVSLIALIKAMCELIGLERHIRMVLGLLMIFAVFGFKAWTEVFFWFSGSVGYSFPLSVAMISVMLWIKNKNMITYVVACVMAFLASGGTLEVAGTSCFVILTILCVKGYRKCNKKDYIYFGIAVFGALINTVAPGNFKRYEGIDDSGLHLFSALIRSINRDISTLEELLFRTPFLIIVVICVMMGIHIGEGKWFSKALAYKLISMCAVMPIVTYFPVYLGYSNTDYFPNRCEFVGWVVVVFTVMLIGVLAGILMKECGCKVGRKEWCGLLLFLCMIMPILSDNYKYSNTVIYRMYENVAMDRFKNYHNQVMGIYKEINKSESEDVVIETLPAAVPDFFDISSALTADSTYWANQAVAEYYGKNSVAVKPQE